MITPALAHELISARGIVSLFQMTDEGEGLPLLLSSEQFFLELSSAFVTACQDRMYQFYWSFLVSRITGGVTWWLAETLWSFLCLLLPKHPFPVFMMILARDNWRNLGWILEPKRWCRVLGKGLSNNCKVNAAGSQDFHFLAETVPPPAHFAVYVTNGKMHCLPAASFSEWRPLEFYP